MVHTTHQQAEHAREHEQDFVKSLQYADSAFIENSQNSDWGAMAESLCTRVNTLKHLYQASRDESYVILGIKEAEAAIEIAGRSDEAGDLALPYLYLAKILEEDTRFREATDAYQKSVEIMVEFKPTKHYRKEVVLDMQNHWYTCAYRADQKMEWIVKAEEALEELEGMRGINKYEQDVWVSGGLMRLARCLREVDTERARGYLERAKEIVDGNGNLILRKGQWEKLAKKVL